MFSGGYINSSIARTKVFVIGFHFKKMTASRLLFTNLDHNFLPLFTMRLDVVTINSIRDKVSGFVTGSVVDEIVTVIVKKSVVERESVVSARNPARTFQNKRASSAATAPAALGASACTRG